MTLGKGKSMKRLMGMAILAAGLALPAHAQAPRATASGMTPGPVSAGGGGFGGGYSSGGSKPTSCPTARFSVTSVSGSQQDYVPSTFVVYDNALAEGRDILANPPKSVAEAAHEQPSVPAEKARISFIQDVNGKATIVVR